MKRTRFAFVAVGLMMLLFGGRTISAQGAVRGQVTLPGGDYPATPIKIEIENARGYHDAVYTDSMGKFVLEGLPENITNILTVVSDGRTWSDTRFEFVPSMTQYIRLALNPYVSKKPVAPPPYKTDPELVDLHDKAMKAFEAGNAEEAERLLRKATDKDPKYALAFNDLGVILMRQRKYAEAEPILQKGLETNPKAISLLMNLGTDFVHEGKYPDAIPPLREALKQQPELGDAELQLGVALVETDQFAEAEQMLLSAEKSKGADNAGVQLYLGKLYSRTGDYPKAIAAFNAFLKLAPPDSPNGPAVRAAIQQMQQQMSGH